MAVKWDDLPRDWKPFSSPHDDLRKRGKFASMGQGRRNNSSFGTLAILVCSMQGEVRISEALKGYCRGIFVQEYARFTRNTRERVAK